MKKHIIFIASLIIGLLAGCGKNSNEPSVSRETPKSAIGDSVVDLADIIKNKELRVLTTSPALQALPRHVSPQEYSLALLENLAETLDVNLTIVNKQNFDELIPALLSGEGDVIAANMTITMPRRKQIAFSIPVTKTREEIVVHTSNAAIRSIKDLSGRTIHVEKGSCYVKTLEKLKTRVPGLIIEETNLDTEELLEKVANKQIELTIADDNFVESFQTYCPDLKIVHTFPIVRFIAWGMNPKAPKLLKIVNQFLSKELPRYAMKNFSGDLPLIKKRRILRMITTNNPFCYFIHRGALMGFEYELMKEFAKRNGLRLVTVVPAKWNDIIPWLAQGKGDVAAAAITITPERKADKAVSFCHPYCDIREKVVTRKSDDSISNIKNLAGRTFVVRRESSYWQTLTNLKNSGCEIKLMTAPSTMESDQIVDKVASGEYDLTLLDSTLLDIEQLRRSDIKSPLALGKEHHYGWLTRSDDTRLREAINKFFEQIMKEPTFNVLLKKYLKSRKNVDKHSLSFSRGYSLSPFDPIIKHYASQRDFPWCLIASQIYQESRFNPKAEDRLGAIGLMQIMPATARELRVKGSLFVPQINIATGTEYMKRMRSRFPDDTIDNNSQFCFSLASYNGGYGHVADARKLAKTLSLNPDIWFGNVEESMKLLTNRRYASRARYGYCRGDMICDYVKDIMFRYRAYAQKEQLKSNTKTDTAVNPKR